MLACTLMRLFEGAPDSYDAAMDLVTLGRLRRMKEAIAGSARPGARVLELGCGTGSLAVLLARRGATVLALDRSEAMLERARRRVEDARVAGGVELRRTSVLDLDALPSGAFDLVVATMLLSALSPEEGDVVLGEARRLLAPGGEIVVGDEVAPAARLPRILASLLGAPFRLAAHLVLEARMLSGCGPLRRVLYFAIELPMMLLVFLVAPRASRPLRNPDRSLSDAGLRPVSVDRFLGGTLCAIRAEASTRETAAIARPGRPRCFANATTLAGRVARILREIPRNVLFYVFRVAPFPTPPGLVSVGCPDRTSPVLVTTNYELTVRRVVRALAGVDCWLLVAPADGINVWCASRGGRFSVDSVVSVLKTTPIAQLVDHRELILPQLAAPGISPSELKRRTGWSATFGPVRARDVPAWLERGRTGAAAIRRVRFPPAERLEMALALWGSLTLRYGWIPLVVLGGRWAATFAALMAGLALLLSLGHRVLPGRTFVEKAAALSLAPIAAASLGTASGALHPETFSSFVALALGAGLLVGSSFPGYSPLWPCGYSRLFYGASPKRLLVLDERCSGCGSCDEVCPVGCFERTPGGAYAWARPDRCEACGACVRNCPTESIVASRLGGLTAQEGCACAAGARS